LIEERSMTDDQAHTPTITGVERAHAADFRPSFPHQSRFTSGDIIAERFVVVRFIARGGMGEVYEVEDQLLHGVRVALKVILPGFADDPASARRFEQEVIMARKVTHPNLCPIYDIARSGSPPPPFSFLTMKLLSGETLSSRLCRPEPIPLEEKVEIFGQMIAGVAAIHAAGIIHRDIKPKNVILDNAGEEFCLTIMDFGLARLHEPEETMATGSIVAGTPGYMAPETLRGEGPSQATDLFALGVLLHQVFTGERPRVGPVTRSVQPSPALHIPDVPAEIANAVKDFLADDPQRRCNAFRAVTAAVGSDSIGAASYPSHTKPITRRQVIIGSAFAAGAALGGVTWKWDQFYNALHPLPAKRFVALLNWPPPDMSVKPMLLGVIEAIGSELARAEAFDRNLLVIAPHTGELTTTAQLNEARDSFGANLVLATSALPRSNQLHLSLRLLDPSSSSPLRSKLLRVPASEEASLPGKAVRAAAQLLGITGYQPDDQRSNAGTANREAYRAFLDAEALRKQENDSGLDGAIEKYKEAIELDPRYALAQARLAWAYLRSYGLRRDPAALTLASLNCKAAIQFNPGLVDAHLGLASVYRQTGDDQGASTEMLKALSLDPSNAHTLTYEAVFYAAANRWAEAEQTFTRVLNLRPNYWLAHNEWGAVLEDQGRYSQALLEFRSASLAAPRNALALKNVGTAYLELGKIPEALKALDGSYSLSADDKSAVALAQAYRLQRKYPEAIGYAEKAVEVNPSEPENWLELGDVYSSAGRPRTDIESAFLHAAETQAEKLTTSPKDGPGWMILALCKAKLGQFELALPLIPKAESFHADDFESQLRKARILELAGNRDPSLLMLARCLSKGPTLFRIQSAPDLEKLRATPEFKRMVASNTASI
jgi:serine/threonine protein kinase/Tfp pilus assembly protein PilF